VDGFAGDFFTGDFVAVFVVARVAATVVDARVGAFAAVPAEAFDVAGAFAFPFALGVGIASAVRSKTRWSSSRSSSSSVMQKCGLAPG
jgi:hypothetical protein